jgi:hypothetical protein
MFLVRTFYTKSQIIDNAYQTLIIYNLFSGYSDTHIIDNCRLLIMSVTDIKDFYLNTPMARYEYMRLKLSNMLDDVIEHYNLQAITTANGFVYCEIRKGMYGLPQAGIIAQQLLETRLAVHGCHQSTTTPGLWRHDTRPICFTLVVDDFRVKYVNKVDAEYLLNTIQTYYKCSSDWYVK